MDNEIAAHLGKKGSVGSLNQKYGVSSWRNRRDLLLDNLMDVWGEAGTHMGIGRGDAQYFQMKMDSEKTEEDQRNLARHILYHAVTGAGCYFRAGDISGMFEIFQTICILKTRPYDKRN